MYEEGQPLNPKQLMMLAKNKYDIIKEKGQWKAPTPDQQQILALKSEIQSLKKSNSNKGTHPKSTNSRNQGKGKKPEWMFKQPEEKELHRYKTWNGRKWYFCGKATGGHCEQYRCHKGSDCKQLEPATTTKKRPQDNRQSSGKDKPKMKLKMEPDDRKAKASKLAKSLSALIPDNQDSDDSSA